LCVAAANNHFEREADRVADEVMAGGRLKHHWSISSTGVSAPLQRKCSCGESGGLGGECEECKQKKEDKTLQRKPSGPTEFQVAPPIVHDVLKSPGQPLDKGTRDFFEPRFAFNFGRIRVHTDNAAMQSAQLLNAAAYTAGEHVVFGPGYYSPETMGGGRLLAHELVHTLQQSRGGQRNGVIQRQTTESTGPSGTLGKVKYLLRDVGDVVSIDRWKKARGCLEGLFPSMKSLTFDRWIPTACARSSRKVLHSREWDAFGHCWIACEGTRQCGGPQTWALGLGREVSREWESRTGGEPHDSLTQDISNQLTGRVSSVKEGTCFAICDGLHKGGLLNLSAPQRTCVDCATYPASGSEGPCPAAAPPAGGK
jgi:hypothetical protein